MYTDEQVKIAETFLGTAVSSGVLTQEACQEMINKIKSQDEVLLTYREVQVILKVSRSTVERMVRSKTLKSGKLNGLIRISKSSVDAVKKKMFAENIEENKKPIN